AVPHREGLPPIAGMRIKRVAEVMVSAISLRVGPHRRTEKREAQHITLIVIAKLGFVDETKAVLPIAKVGPALRRNFELGLFPTVVARSGAFDAAERNFVSGMAAGCGQRESGLEQNVSLVPVDVVNDVNLIGSSVERDVLHKL